MIVVFDEGIRIGFEVRNLVASVAFDGSISEGIDVESGDREGTSGVSRTTESSFQVGFIDNGRDIVSYRPLIRASELDE